METVRLTFESKVAASASEVWSWATSVKGISAEMWPVLKMTIPKGKSSILDFEVAPGQPLFRSWLLLAGVLPIDCSELTLLEVEDGRRFLEQSPMLSMRLWRHERVLTPTHEGTSVSDNLEFSPRFGTPVVRWFVKVFFQHRHAVLRRVFSNRRSVAHV